MLYSYRVWAKIWFCSDQQKIVDSFESQVVEILGKIGKGVNCSVTNCKNAAERSISRDQLGASGLSVPGDRRVFLCHEHYKIWKKATKKDRELDRVRFK